MRGDVEESSSITQTKAEDPASCAARAAKLHAEATDLVKSITEKAGAVYASDLFTRSPLTHLHIARLRRISEKAKLRRQRRLHALCEATRVKNA